MKYLWVQKGGGDFKIGKDITECNLKFNPIKINVSIDEDFHSNIELLKYLPAGTDTGSGNFIIMYVDTIEKVRVKWYKLIISHYNHLLCLGDLINLSSDWSSKIKAIEEEIINHRKGYPELWV